MSGTSSELTAAAPQERRSDSAAYGYVSRREGMTRYLLPAIVAACVTFNMILCFINTHVMSISTPIIMGCELLLIGMAISYGFFRMDKVKMFWICILGLQVVLVLLLSYGKHELLAKSLRDVIIMPIFIVLGLSAYRLDLTKFFLGLGIVIFGFAVFEAMSPNSFVSLFDIRKYYIGKGAMEDIVISDLNVFASGVRPGGRFLLDLPGVHRISSLFLEPVSLGFYAVISAMYYIARKDQISRTVFIAGLTISFLLIWLSDARLAMGTFAVVFLLRGVFARIDHRFAVLMLPVMVLIAVCVDTFNLLDTSGEGLGYRLFVTARLLSFTNIDILLGLSDFRPLTVVDSGIGDLLSRQGLLGIMLYWLSPILFMRKLAKAPRIYTHSMALFIGFGFLISPAFFSIKTASLLWFQLGYLIGRDMRDESGVYRAEVT